MKFCTCTGHKLCHKKLSIVNHILVFFKCLFTTNIVGDFIVIYVSFLVDLALN